MRIRTANQLQDKIDSERVWRIREIAALKSQCFATNIAVDASKAVRRSFVPIAYAHWEGFVKKSAHYYLEYVAMQGLPLQQLSPPFISMYLTQKFATKLASKGTYKLIEIYETLMAANEGVIRIDYKEVVSAEDNLNSEVLKNICNSLGLDFDCFKTKTLFIDIGLVKKRNKIAHGEMQDVDEADLEEVKLQVVNLIDLFKTEIENAVALCKFRN